jgi:hypothetical protein
MAATHTFVKLAISEEAYKEIRERLVAAGYGHCVTSIEGDEAVDMNGLAIMPETRDTVAVYLAYKGGLIKKEKQ